MPWGHAPLVRMEEREKHYLLGKTGEIKEEVRNMSLFFFNKLSLR